MDNGPCASQILTVIGTKPGLSYFQDLPWDVRQRAYQWLNRFIKRREATHGGVPDWLFAIYVGQAKRLALNPPTSSWGRSMLAKRGGLAVQRRYRLEGRDATARATRCRVLKQNAKKRADEEARLGLPAPALVKYLPLD